jgi:hypothetical protein
LVSASILLSDGHLVYTLDDPYIHLSVAENILHGSYGVNAQENSSPSSSILFPLFLTPFVLSGWGFAGPLLINTLATGLSVWLLLEFYWDRAVAAGTSKIFPHLFSALLILAINAFALPLTGMEHSLHVLLVVLAIRKLIELIETDRPSVLLFVAIVCMPLVRFEGLAFAFAAILTIALSGHRRLATMLGLSIGAFLLFYGVLVHRLGLPFFPSSVLVKSNLAASVEDGERITGILVTLTNNFRSSLDERWGVIFTFSICFILAMSRDSDGWNRRNGKLLVGIVAGLSLAGHLFAGRYDWFHRYEVYAVAVLVGSGIYLLRARLSVLTKNGHRLQKLAVVAAGIAFVSPYLTATILTPYASRGIYDQQFQMHRFATEFFSRPVAVNDLGWMSYENENFVLDLWGLGSERIRKLRAAGRFDAKAMAEVVDEAKVDYAMIYDPWFDGIVPKNWCRLAYLDSNRVTSAYGRVSIYATRSSVLADLNDALDRFAPTLPARVHLTRFAC